MLNLAVKTIQLIPVVIIDGRIDAQTSVELDKAMVPLKDQKFLIIDFRACSYLSSSGIRSLLKAAKLTAAAGGALFLASVSNEVFQVLKMTGLTTIFRFSETVEAAVEEMNALHETHLEKMKIETDDSQFSIVRQEKYEPPMYHWKDEYVAGYDELEFALGKGSFTDGTENMKFGQEGLFTVLGHCAGLVPNNQQMPPDFRVVQDLSSGLMSFQSAFSFSGVPKFQLSSGDFKGSVKELWKTIVKIHEDHSTIDEPIAAGLIFNFADDAPSISFFVNRGSNSLNALRKEDLFSEFASDNAQLGITFKLEELHKPEATLGISEVLKEVLTIENILEVAPLSPDELIVHPFVGLFTPVYSENINRRLLRIVLTDGEIDPVVDFLVRRLYTDSSRVVLKQLHGGFSAQTYQVDSYDSESRKLRPTVLKTGSKDMIDREAKRCHDYAMPYILNNSAMVLGAEFLGNVGALRYNFVGIGGEESKLKWLTSYYEAWPIEELEPLFDKIFLKILHPWYGQSIETKIFPFLDHDPTQTFFPNICEEADQILSISTNDQFIFIPELNEERLNPYWFLKHEYPSRYETALQFNTSICHGDLNMQNILLDEKMNVYLIDFSETRPRSVVADFARLEAIFMLEYVHPKSADELKTIADFFKKFYSSDYFVPNIKDYAWDALPEKMKRNVAMVRKMRSYALDASKELTVELPYFLALLEWTLPVVCYSSVNDQQKRLSMIVSSLLCEQINKQNQ